MARKISERLDRRDADAIISPLRESPSFLVRLTQLTAFDEFHRHFAGLGMTPGRFSVFSLIVNNPGIRPGTIAGELRIKPSNVAVLVNALASDRLVERRQDKTELRASKLHSTRAGLKAYQQLWDIHLHLDELLLAPLSASERRTFVAMLRKLDRHMNKDAAEA